MASEPEIYIFRTPLTAEQTAEALRSSMDESELDFIFRISAEGHRPIIGNADESECNLMRRPRSFSNDYAGIFTAAIFEEQGCTRLDGRFVKVTLGFPLGSRNSNVSSTTSIKVGLLLLIGFQVYNVIGSFMERDHPYSERAVDSCGRVHRCFLYRISCGSSCQKTTKRIHLAPR